MSISLNNFNLKTINKNNPEDLEFLETIFNNQDDKNIDYLGNMKNYITERTFIVTNSKAEKVGYFSMTEPVLNRDYQTTTSLYYAILPKYRNQGYASNLVSEIITYLFEQNIVDMVVLTIDNQNIYSKAIAEKLGFEISFQDEEETIYTKHAKSNRKTK